MNLRSCLSFLILIAVVTSKSINLDVIQNLCGDRLRRAMTDYCELFYTNDDSTTPSSLEDEDENKIVTFCCERACSIRNLIKEFCKKVKDEYREAFDTKPTPPPLPIPEKLQDPSEEPNAIVAQISDERKDAAATLMAPSQKSKLANSIRKDRKDQKEIENLNTPNRIYRKANIGYATSNQQKPILIDQELKPLSVENVEIQSLQHYYRDQ